MGGKSNVDEFNAELEEFAVSLKPNVFAKAVRSVALEGLARLVAKTPVDTGHARAGWQVTVGAPADGQVEGVDESTRSVDDVKASSSTFQQGAAVINAQIDSDPLVEIFITNNVEYIEVLEEGRVAGGFETLQTPFGEITSPRRTGARGSIQAPEGMLAVTFAELVDTFEEITEAA